MTSGNPHRNRRNGDIIRTMILHLHLVRHGQTYFNRYNRLQGWSNSPLTESGVADAVKAGERLKGLTFAAAYCSDTTRAQQTAEKILDINEAAGNPRPALVTDMHFREQFYGYYEGLDMAMAWYAAGAPHGVKTYNQIVEKFGLGASRDFLKEADPFHDAESDEEYWTRVEGAFRLIADNPNLKDGDDVLQMDAYDLVSAALAEEAGEVYDYDRAHIAAHGFPVIEREDRDTSEFRNYWLYMPQFRVLDQNDFVTTMAVFLVLFIFIALICFAAFIVIAFTRCMTIALTNARVYDDLRHLGAPNRYLFRSVKGQVSKVFLVPAIVGTAVISAFYLMIMYFNDNRFTPGEMAGMAVCAAVIAVLSAVLYGVYRITRRSVCRALGIQGK